MRTYMNHLELVGMFISLKIKFPASVAPSCAVSMDDYTPIWRRVFVCYFRFTFFGLAPSAQLFRRAVRNFVPKNLMVYSAYMKLLSRNVYFQIIRLYYGTIEFRLHGLCLKFLGYAYIHTYIHTYMNITSYFLRYWASWPHLLWNEV